MRILESDLDKIMKFMVEADKLKAVDRAGWVIYRIKNPEHVGDHSYSTALLSYMMARKLGLDAGKCAIMALIHDINEVITSDIATRVDERQQVVSNKVKAMLEEKNTLKILKKLDKSTNSELKAIWNEFKAGKSKEAQLVYEIDKLDYVIQLILYHKQIKSDADLESFFETARRRLTIPELLYIYDKVRKQVYKER